MTTDSPVVNPPPLASTTFHPEYAYWADLWESIRDAVMGEVQIKRGATRYLPKPEAMTKQEYEAYLSRAVYYNMTARTVVGLSGSLFRRPGKSKVPEKYKKGIESITNYGTPLDQMTKQVAREVFTMGRYGVLLDMDKDGKKPPYLSGYISENIIDWTEEEIDGRQVLTEVVLRELRLDNGVTDGSNLSIRYVKSGHNKISVTKSYLASYRVLRLVNVDGQLVYHQFYFRNPSGNATIDGKDAIETIPTYRGKPFNFIPFMFFGPNDNKPMVNKSPILDIVSLNMSHYTSYAQLEQGRWYTAQPVYYVPTGPGESKGSYTLGPNVVWEVDSTSKPGILEYHGSGLMFLEHSIEAKEEQIATLGQEKLGPGQSDNKMKMQEANESALLLNVSFVLDYGFTMLLRWWAAWQDATDAEMAEISYETNKSFILSNAAAREFRAIQMMYEAGVIPIDVLFDYLSQAEVIPEWMDMEQFKALLEQEDSFPNQADIHAQMEGAPDAATQWKTENPDANAILAAQTTRKVAAMKPKPKPAAKK
jgi:hypothetical protein